MDFTEKQIASEEIFRGKIVHLVRDTVVLPDGKEATREIVHHPGAVAVVAVTSDRRVLLVTQYRYAFARNLTEIPAGKLEIGEDPFEAVKRELREETGAVASVWHELGSFFATPAVFDEHIHLYYATGLTFGDNDLDEDEFLSVSSVDLDEAAQMAARGDFPDGKTQAGILRAQYLISRGELEIR